MEFNEAVSQIAAKVRDLKDGIQTEEATKNAFIMPFIGQVLGYDVFNPNEVIPEFTAVVGTPKTHELRTVMFPAVLGPLLPVRGKGDDDLLFADPTGPTGYIMQVDSPKTGSSWFTRACDAAGVPRMTVHDLRHTAASLMVRSGANVKAVQRQLGHASAAMTLDVYADLFDDDLDAVSESMNRLLIDANVGNMWAREGILTA